MANTTDCGSVNSSSTLDSHTTASVVKLANTSGLSPDALCGLWVRFPPDARINKSKCV